MLTLKETRRTCKKEGSTEHVGQILEMKKFVKFWGGIQEKDDRTPEMPWMESVREQLKDY